MIKIKEISEIKLLPEPEIREYICEKANALMEEYNVDNLDNIGCFIVFEKEEITDFNVSEMEFVEVLEIGNKHYFHGVKILGDSYGEDIFLPIEVMKK